MRYVYILLVNLLKYYPLIAGSVMNSLVLDIWAVIVINDGCAIRWHHVFLGILIEVLIV